MKSAATIKINFQKALRQAQELEELSQELNRIASNQVGGALDGVRASWKSESATLYVKKGTVLKEKLQKTAKNLNEIASRVRTIAETTYQAEMEAIRIAETRG